MAKEAAVGLFHVRTTKRGAEKTEQVNLRMPVSLLDYAEKEAAAQQKDRTDIILSALMFQRDLVQGLAPLKQRIAMAAVSENLDWPVQEVEIIRRLVERGLNDLERGKRR